MRILCVGNRYPPWSLGGYEVIWADTVAALRRRGDDVRVLTTVPDPTDLPGGGAAEVHRDLRWYWRAHEFPRVSLIGAAQLERRNAAVLRRHIEEHRPAAIVWWAMGGMSLSLIAQARRLGVPAVGVVGDDWMSYGIEVDGWLRRFDGWRRPIAPLAERLAGVPARVDLARDSKWLFISRYTRDEATRSGWDVGRCDVAHPGVDPERFPWREQAAWAWRLLYCGRIDRRKGVDQAVEALAHLPAQATLTIDGHGDEAYIAELQALAHSLGVRDRVSFQRSAHGLVAESYAAADALIFPVRWREPWGLVPLEAMSVGRAVITTRAGGGAGEYLVEGENSLAFDAGDARALAAAVTRIAQDDDLRARLIDGGRATAARFSASAFHDAVAEAVDATAFAD
jgi:glycosyltransferase involved in cell wall biosynthesis